jgi:hypothetical protein
MLTLRTTTDPGLRASLAALDEQIGTLDAAISSAEKQINSIIYSLYALTEAEITLVGNGVRLCAPKNKCLIVKQKAYEIRKGEETPRQTLPS